jgi:hypothetical protein
LRWWILPGAEPSWSIKRTSIGMNISMFHIYPLLVVTWCHCIDLNMRFTSNS